MLMLSLLRTPIEENYNAPGSKKAKKKEKIIMSSLNKKVGGKKRSVVRTYKEVVAKRRIQSHSMGLDFDIKTKFCNYF